MGNETSLPEGGAEDFEEQARAPPTAIDPNSGTAVMTETIRILGHKVNTTSWRPRRSIMFANWGAEEHGTIGSFEFAQDYRALLMDRAVAYINMDLCTYGPLLDAYASPSIKYYIQGE